MRYFIHKSFTNELFSRKEYLYDVFSIWTIPYNYNSDFIVLKSIPLNSIDICFILGHNWSVKKFIENNSIHENHIVAITCDGYANFGSLNLRNKKLFLPNQDLNNLAPLLKGDLYGFNFDLTESEILFYNSSKYLPLSIRLNNCFSKY